MKLYGSLLSEECRLAFERLKTCDIEYEFIDINASVDNLREFLALRDNEEKFLHTKSCGDIGIPCYVLDDHTITFDTSRVIGIYNTIWNQSVTGVLIKDGRVLLGRHTYGAGKGKLIVPGGYMSRGESPEQAIIREYREETGIEIKPADIIGIRFNSHDWYVAFSVEYISGEARSDNEENSEVVWLDIEEALSREDVPELTKYLIQAAISQSDPLRLTDFKNTNEKHGVPTLYTK